MRIDKLVPGDRVTLRFLGGSKWNETHDEPARFISLCGSGSDRRATFVSRDHNGKAYEWDAYRYEGRWVYGTSADRLQLVEVHERVAATS